MPNRRRDKYGSNRNDIMKEKGLCYNCCQHGHRSFNCRNETVCYDCNSYGHTQKSCPKRLCNIAAFEELGPKLYWNLPHNHIKKGPFKGRGYSRRKSDAEEEETDDDDDDDAEEIMRIKRIDYDSKVELEDDFKPENNDKKYEITRPRGGVMEYIPSQPTYSPTKR